MVEASVSLYFILASQHILSQVRAVDAFLSIDLCKLVTFLNNFKVWNIGEKRHQHFTAAYGWSQVSLYDRLDGQKVHQI